MSDQLSRRILEHVADQRYKPRTVRALAEELGVDASQIDEFCHAVEQLIEEDQIVLGAGNTVGLPPLGREMIGLFRKNERGFGFIVPDIDKRSPHGDLFVPAPNTGDAMTGDRVRARVIHERGRAGGGRSPYVGRIVEIIQRADKHYVGVLAQQGARWIVRVDGKSMHEPVVIRDPHAKNASAGQKVVIELIQYPTADQEAEGVILEVLGQQGEPEVETLSVMRAYGLPSRFPAEVLEQARESSQRFDARTIPEGREDLTGTFIVTIDPPDAKDYDDAINISRLDPSKEPDGAAWELGIHIADVSHFVERDTALDQEAYARANSTYLPRKVVPMLPEVLSNGVCSLQEGVNRFTKSAFMRYDENGKVLHERFANGVIRSARRMTYLEAQAMIDGDLKEARRHSKSTGEYPAQLSQTLKHMDQLARVIRQRRLKAGMVVLDLPEVELIYDETGRVIDAQPEDDAFTHKIIEMFMVEANEATARLFERLDVPMIRRIHPDPSAHDLDELRQYARVAGFTIPAKPSRHELQRLLDSVRGQPAQQAVHFAVLKTLSQAQYSPQLIGHFALASEHYTHFTSPIRRYPDLVVHRAIDAYLEAAGQVKKGGRKGKDKLGRIMRDDPRCPDEKALAELGRHCSGMERNSEAAERQLRNYLVLELLAQHLGDDFAGTVTGVTASGAFMQIDKYLVDGLIRLNDLPGGRTKGGDQWRYNRTTGSLVAQRSGRTINVGDRFTVRIAKVDAAARLLDLVIIEEAPQTTPKRTQPPGAKKSHQLSMKIKRTKKKRNHRGRR